MKISLKQCPLCQTELWGQKGNKEEEEKNISYRVCTSHTCKYRVKVEWDAENLKLKLAI